MSKRARLSRALFRTVILLAVALVLHACSSGDASVGSLAAAGMVGSSGIAGVASGGNSSGGSASGGTASGGTDNANAGTAGDSCPAGLDAPTPCTSPCNSPLPLCSSPCSPDGKACTDPSNNVLLCNGGIWRCPMLRQQQNCPALCLPPPMSGNPPCGSRPCSSSERCCVLPDPNGCSLGCVATPCLDQSCR